MVKNAILLFLLNIEKKYSLKIYYLLRKIISPFLNSAINILFPSEAQYLNVLTGELKGTKMEFFLPNDSAYWFGGYEIFVQRTLVDRIKSNMIAYDIGANIGFMSLLLGRCVGPQGKIYSFEIHPGALDQLRYNLEFHKDWSTFSVIPMAITDRVGEQTFYYSKGNNQIGKLDNKSDSELILSTSVNTTSIDELIFKNNYPFPDFIKMDIEGEEERAILGMHRLMEEAAPIVLIELHTKNAVASVWNVLHQHDYTIHSTLNNYPEIKTLDSISWRSPLSSKETQDKWINSHILGIPKV